MVDHKRGPRSGGAGKPVQRAPVPHAELGAKVLEAAPVVILLLDRHGAIEYVNPYFERLTGYRLDEIRGKDWFETILPGRDHERLREMFQHSFEGISLRGDVNPLLTRTGEQRDIEWTDEVLRDAEGRPTGLLAIGHDVTERKAAQDALRASAQRFAEAHRIARIGVWHLDLAS